MGKSAPRLLLNELLNRLGSEWYRASATVICRSDRMLLAQCISCQSSNVDSSFVPATFVHLLARQSDGFRYDFGGRIKAGDSSHLWLDATEPLPIDLVFRLASEQAAVPFETPLSTHALADYLDRQDRTRFEFAQWWSAGIVYGVCGRAVDANHCLSMAQSLLTKLRAKLDPPALAKAGWISDALADITEVNALLGTPVQLSSRCIGIARASAASLGLKDFS